MRYIREDASEGSDIEGKCIQVVCHIIGGIFSGLYGFASGFVGFDNKITYVYKVIE